MDAPSPRAPTRPVTLQRLQVFCAVHDRGSISAAARAGPLAALVPRGNPLASDAQVDLAALAAAGAVRLTPQGPSGGSWPRPSPRAASRSIPA